MRMVLACSLVFAPVCANAQEIDSGGVGLGGPGRSFTDNPLKRYPTPFPTTPWFGLGSPQVPSAGNASADSPIVRFTLSFDELQALIEGQPFQSPREQQLQDINTLLGRTITLPPE